MSTSYERKRKRENDLKLKQEIRSFSNTIISAYKKEVTFQSKNCLLPYGTELNDELVQSYHDLYHSDEKNRAINRNIVNIPIPFLAVIQKHHTFTYSHLLKTNLTSTDQGNSGRCWLFAGLNTIRYALITNYNLPRNFQLSQAYLFYWDKIERANTFLEHVISNKHLDQKDHYIQKLIHSDESLLSDGGFWQSFANLVVKYGVMPISKYDETWNSYSSGYLNQFYRKKLLEFLHVIRTSNKTEEEIRVLKDTVFMAEIYKMISNFMTVPPKNFDWHYYTGGNNGRGEGDEKILRHENDLEPLQFYEKFVKPVYDITDKIVLQHDPRPEIKLWHTYNNRFYSNSVGMPPVSYVNAPLKVLKDAVFLSITNDQPCWIGCDVSKDFDWSRNILDPESFNYSETLNIENLVTNKTDLYALKLSECTHAMCITGVDLNIRSGPGQRKYLKYRVENSWGYHGDQGKEDPGYLLMTDQWFDQHMYQVVISFSILPKDIQGKIESRMFQPIELNLDDNLNHPMKN